jgi:hypothetical protein
MVPPLGVANGLFLYGLCCWGRHAIDRLQKAEDIAGQRRFEWISSILPEMKIISTLFKFFSLLAADDHHTIKLSGLYKGRIIQKSRKEMLQWETLKPLGPVSLAAFPSS